MSDANKLGLGQIIETEQQRDAIHIAVAPVVASERLEPGQHVGLFASGASVAAEPLIGVVDPFLKRSVVKGEQFWLFLYPGTVTGLRHEWSHSSFPMEAGKGMASSEIWLRAYAMRLSPYDTPEKAYSGLLDGLRNREVFAHGSDLHGFYELEDSDGLKRHAEAVLGISINWGGFSFSCSC